MRPLDSQIRSILQPATMSQGMWSPENSTALSREKEWKRQMTSSRCYENSFGHTLRTASIECNHIFGKTAWKISEQKCHGAPSWSPLIIATMVTNIECMRVWVTFGDAEGPRFPQAVSGGPNPPTRVFWSPWHSITCTEIASSLEKSSVWYDQTIC